MDSQDEHDRPEKASFIKVRLLIAILIILCPILCQECKLNLYASYSYPIDHAHQGNVSFNTSQISHNHNDYKTTSPIIFNVNRKRSNESDDKQVKLTTTDKLSIIEILDKMDRWKSQELKLRTKLNFLFTYMIFLIPGARLAEHGWMPERGAKWILMVASLGSALLNSLAPLLARVSETLVPTVSYLMGMFQGAVYPACYVLYSKWLPPHERSIFLPILCTINCLGALPRSLFLELTETFNKQATSDWFNSVHATTVMCLIWSVFWYWYGSNEPRDHRHISIEEICSIESRFEVSPNKPSSGRVHSSASPIESLEVVAESRPARALPAKTQRKISWGKLWQSTGVTRINDFGFASSLNLNFLILGPFDVDRSLGNAHSNIGTLLVIYCILSLLVGVVSTLMVKKRTFEFNRLRIRKLFQGVALVGQGICMFGTFWFGRDPARIDQIRPIQIVFLSLVNGGEVHLPGELSAEFPGTIYAISELARKMTEGLRVVVTHSVVQSVIRDSEHVKGENLSDFLLRAIVTAKALIAIFRYRDEIDDFSNDPDEPSVPANENLSYSRGNQ